MAKKTKSQTKQIVNRRARYDYALDDSLLVGIQLSGPEVKALRQGRGNLRGAYVTIKDSAKSARGGGELWLVNANITGSSSAPIAESDQTRSRKLLAKRREIDKLIATKQQGKTIVALELLTKGRYIKLRLAPGRGKKHYDKRATIKARDEQRRINAAVRFNSR